MTTSIDAKPDTLSKKLSLSSMVTGTVGLILFLAGKGSQKKILVMLGKVLVAIGIYLLAVSVSLQKA